MRLTNAVKLNPAGRGQVIAEQGREWLRARCGAPGCTAHWQAVGRIDCQRKLRQIQNHANRHLHPVQVEHANAQGAHT